MEYHPYITNANRETTGADRMNVFGPGTDPAGLGTLGAPVNVDHVFEYLGENMPPSGNPQAVVARGAGQWERGFEKVYGGRFIRAEQSRLSPNTTTITMGDSEPLVSRPDNLTSVKNNAQIAREKTARTVRTFQAAPSADALANSVSADAELRNLQAQAVSMAYESQMDAIRATHLGAKSRGNALRGGSIGAMPLINIPKPIRMAPIKTLTPVTPLEPKKIVPSSTNGGLPFLVGGGGGEIVMSEGTEDTGYTYNDSYVDTRFEPTKVALVLGGVAVAAAVAYFMMRGR